MAVQSWVQHPVTARCRWNGHSQFQRSVRTVKLRWESLRIARRVSGQGASACRPGTCVDKMATTLVPVPMDTKRGPAQSFRVVASLLPEQDVKLLLCTTFDEGEGNLQGHERREPSGDRDNVYGGLGPSRPHLEVASSCTESEPTTSVVNFILRHSGLERGQDVERDSHLSALDLPPQRLKYRSRWRQERLNLVRPKNRKRRLTSTFKKPASKPVVPAQLGNDEHSFRHLQQCSNGVSPFHIESNTAKANSVCRPRV